VEVAVHLVAPADGADAREEPHPVLNEDEDEESNQQGKSSREGVLAYDGFEQITQGLEHGFENGLALGRENLWLADRVQDETDEQGRDRPAGGHAVGNGPAVAEIRKLGGCRGYSFSARKGRKTEDGKEAEEFGDA
jgi:hypothetical protein